MERASGLVALAISSRRQEAGQPQRSGGCLPARNRVEPRAAAAGEVFLPDGPAMQLVARKPSLEQLAGCRAVPQRRAMEGTAGGLVRESDGHGVRFREVDVRVQGEYLTRVAADRARSRGETASGRRRRSDAIRQTGRLAGFSGDRLLRGDLASVLAEEAEESPPAPPPKLPAPEGATRLSPDFDVWLDAKRGAVLVDGQVSLRRGHARNVRLHPQYEGT